MTLEEALEFCVVHRATVSFETWTTAKGFEDKVTVWLAYRQDVGHSGEATIDGLIDAVKRAQRSIWEEWRYQQFTHVPYDHLESGAPADVLTDVRSN